MYNSRRKYTWYLYSSLIKIIGKTIITAVKFVYWTVVQCSTVHIISGCVKDRYIFVHAAKVQSLKVVNLKQRMSIPCASKHHNAQKYRIFSLHQWYPNAPGYRSWLLSSKPSIQSLNWKHTGINFCPCQLAQGSLALHEWFNRPNAISIPHQIKKNF